MDSYFNNQPQSFWIASTPAKVYPSLKEDLTVGVAIVGGGIAGILCAYMLNKNGVKSAVFDSNKILQATTGHTTAKITSQHALIYDKLKTKVGSELAAQYADANESAIRMFEKIASENNIECDFLPQSAYVYTQSDDYIEKIKNEVDAAASFGIKASFSDNIPLPFSIKAAVRFENQAQYHPRKLLVPLAEKLSTQGVQIFEQTRIVNLEEDSKGYFLITGNGKKIFAEKVIIASHYPFFNKHGMYFARIYTERSYVIAAKVKENYPGGMYISAEDPTRSFRNQPDGDGELILIGGENHKTGQGKDMYNHYDALAKYANEIYDVTDIPYRWSTQDCMTLDDIPYVGHYTSNTPDLFIATGFGKWGMTNSMASAMLLSDLIIGDKNPWQDVYDPARDTFVASAKNFIVENVNVAGQLLGGKLSPIPDKVDIKKGEAKIIEVEGNRAGAYRDEKGKLHIINTTCTHMGCELNWNSAEKSWDCPCHGSRFTIEGEVIEGPAVKPLENDYNVNTIEKLIKDEY